MNVLFFLAGLGLGIVLAGGFLYHKMMKSGFEKSQIESEKLSLEKNIIELQKEISLQKNTVSENEFKLTRINADNLYLKDKVQTQNIELEKLYNKVSIEFENLANKIFDEKSKKFIEQNKTSIDTILSPLKENIKDFHKKVEETYDKESQARFSLHGEIKKLYELNQQITKEANNLTNALKGHSKSQGNWGEMILESILEKSGLAKGREFFTQLSLVADTAKTQRPDVIIKLPEDKSIIVDSKVSLNAYERFCSSDDPQQKTLYLNEHVASVRKHVKELSQKDYQNLYKINGLDYVLLFLPIEGAFGLAVQNDNELFTFAFEKNIVIVSPSTLLATLKIIAGMWRYENQNKNVMLISQAAGALYDKFVLFLDDFVKMGQQIQTANSTYESALNKLASGKGNLIKRAEDIKALGAKTTKNIPSKLVNISDESEEKIEILK